MVFLRGNLALRDHSENGEKVHLFEQVAGGLHYDGQMVRAGYYERDDVPDRNGDLCRAIVFELVPSTRSRRRRVPTQSSRPRPTRAGRCRSTSSATGPLEPSGSSEAKRRTYVRSEDLRICVRRRADGRCEGCTDPAPFMTARGHPYLEPHHTRRLSDGGPDDYHHVIALCPTCHHRVHHAADGESYNEELRLKLEAIEPQ
jgi:5-methylcytosine-specific restriction protein A